MIAALLILVPTLAVLQYRWVGQVSDAERDRMETHVGNAAVQFRDALDGEIARAVINLQVSTAAVRDGFSDRYRDRFEAWQATSAHPQIVANILVLDASDAGVQLRRWNPTSHVFEATDWPATLLPWRPQFEQELTALREGRQVERRLTGAAIDESIVLAPLRPMQGDGPPQDRRADRSDPTRPDNAAPSIADRSDNGRPDNSRDRIVGVTVVNLDMAYIRSQMLPELAQRYFQTTEEDGYRVAVVNAENPKTVIYTSDPDTPFSVEAADTTEPLFGMRGDNFFFNRGGRGGNRRTVVVPMFRDRDGGRSTDQRPEPRDGDARDPQVDRNTRPPDRDFGRWLLLAQHRSGSLDAAVASARNRNLAIGFGILIMLTMSVGMLALSSRRAQELARQQMEFVAGVSHELRTPIAVIRSAAENLSQGVVGTPDRVKRYGDTIGSEARRLGETVENVMQYAGLESGRGLTALGAVSPASIIDEALTQASPAIAAVNAVIERRMPDTLPAIAGDAAALRSAVQNLIVNAIKYGGADRWVGVRAEHVREGRHGLVRITVEDHGSGVPAADLPHIFEPFFRGSEAIGRQVQGNGLGLSIVKRIVTAHGGTITVATTPGKGSAFTMTLPAADPTAAAAVSDQCLPVASS